MVSKLSGTTKNLTHGLMSDPQKIENLISMVRTVAPLTSPQIVTKVNTYLPPFEKVSTLLGMYSFLNRAQTFRPIEAANSKSPVDMISALMKNGNLPVSKMIAQPLIANNIEKIVGSMAMNMVKNGNINDILGNGNINDILASFAQNSGKASSSDNSANIDLNSLMETFMPIINSMSANNSANHEDEGLKHESYLPEDESETSDYSNSNEHEFSYDEYDKYDMPTHERYDRNYRNDRYDNYDKSINYNDHKNNYNDKKDTQKPVRIKQRRRR